VGRRRLEQLPHVHQVREGRVGGVSAEQLAEAYDDGWSMAVFATMPEGMSGEAQILRAVAFPPVDNPHREPGSRPRSRLVVPDRGAVAWQLALAVDGSTTDSATWLRVVDALVESGALREIAALPIERADHG
jgi:hypothetical protein